MYLNDNVTPYIPKNRTEALARSNKVMGNQMGGNLQMHNINDAKVWLGLDENIKWLLALDQRRFNYMLSTIESAGHIHNFGKKANCLKSSKGFLRARLKNLLPF